MKFTNSLLTLPAIVGSASANFFTTCANPRTAAVSTQFFLFADCYDAAGTLHGTSSLDLSNCLANNNGVMEPRDNGGFATSCHDLSLDAGTRGLQATCTSDDGGVGLSVVPLDFVQNDTGVLSCFGHRGVYVSELAGSA